MRGIANLLDLPVRYKPWRPRHIRLTLGDVFAPAAQPEQGHNVHLDAAIDWLCRAQDIRDDEPDAGGVSAGWSFEDGWLPSYPETTGYIIETFLAAADTRGQVELVTRAQRMIDWELSLQSADGSFPGHFGEPGSQPVIFNQGQIMHGLVAGYTQLGRQDCLEAGVRAGYWLVKQQDSDGCFRRFEHNDVPHVYNTRATWPLISIGKIAGEPDLVAAGRRNMGWALAQQHPDGWFATNAFRPGQVPFTHTVAYAMRGLLEAGVLLAEQRFIDAAILCARGVRQRIADHGHLPGALGPGWRPAGHYACLTGNAQMSVNFTRLAQVTGDMAWRASAKALIGFVKRCQRLGDRAPEVRGGIPGSSPIWGAYSRFEFPNWAAKFFADALMMDRGAVAVPPVPELPL